jgi:hypothetical protein
VKQHPIIILIIENSFHAIQTTCCSETRAENYLVVGMIKRYIELEVIYVIINNRGSLFLLYCMPRYCLYKMLTEDWYELLRYTERLKDSLTDNFKLIT